MTNSVWTLATQPSLIVFCRFSILHQFYAMRSPQMLEHSPKITSSRGVICRGTRFHSGCQCSIWPAPRVSSYRELSSSASHSGASGCILCALAFGNIQFWHPFRVSLIGELLTFSIRNPCIPAHLTMYPSIHSGAPDYCPWYTYETLKSSLLEPSRHALNCILLDYV
jgi:hypothetical protein